MLPLRRFCLGKKCQRVPDMWIILLSLPALLTFWAILTYGVGILYGDELLYVPRLVKLATHSFTWTDAFALHHDHRPTLPFFITAVSVFSIGWHAPYKYFLSLIFTLISARLLSRLFLLSHPHLFARTHLFFALAAITFATSLLQFDIWFQGMFLSVPLLMLCFLAALTLVVKYRASWPAIALAVLCCLAATLTLHQGIFTFFALLPLILANPEVTQRRSKAATLTVLGIFTTALYHLDYNSGQFGGDLLYGLRRPLEFIQFTLAFWGAPLAPTSLPLATLLGLVVVILATFLSFYHLRRPQRHQALPWLSLLILIGLISFATALGRVWLSPGYSLRPRYLAMSYLGIIALLPLIASFLYIKQANLKLFHLLLVVLVTGNLLLGLLSLPAWQQKAGHLQTGRHCFATYQSSSLSCLGLLGIDSLSPQDVYQRAKTLHQNNLLPAVIN